VIYDIKGGAFFLEDGVEVNNTLQYNLGVYVHPSTSLLNDDLTPALLWVTNPYNTIQHNHGGGISHNMVWYRMFENPTGPSHDPNYCLQHVPLLA
jgi:hypothetical protein